MEPLFVAPSLLKGLRPRNVHGRRPPRRLSAVAAEPPPLSPPRQARARDGREHDLRRGVACRLHAPPGVTIGAAMSDGWNFAEVFEELARAQPDEMAQRHAGRTTSWADFDRRADGVAAAL